MGGLVVPASVARVALTGLTPLRISETPDTSQIRAFLKNKQWETRVAAAKTISCICEGVKHATVADVARLAGINPEAAAEAALALPPSAVAAADAAVDLTFDEFDIVGVIERAAPLLASKVGDSHLSGVDDAKLSKAERLKMAKQTLRQRLGMAIESDGAAETVKGEDAKPTNLNVNKFIDVDDLVGEDDVAEVKTEAPAAAAAKVDAADLSQLSARERNRLKRKQKRSAKDEETGAAPAAKRARAASPPTPRLRNARRRRRRRRRRKPPRWKPADGRWRERARRSRTASSRRGGKNATAPPPRSVRCCDITPRTPAYLDRRLEATPRLSRTRRLRRDPTPRGWRTWRFVCSVSSPSIVSAITSVTAWWRPFARLARRRSARVCCRFPPTPWRR